MIGGGVGEAAERGRSPVEGSRVSREKDVGVPGNEEQGEADGKHETGREDEPRIGGADASGAPEAVCGEEQEGRRAGGHGHEVDETDGETEEFFGAHEAAYSFCMTLSMLGSLPVCFMAGAPVGVPHVAVSALGTMVCFVGGYALMRKAGQVLPARPAHPPFLECRMAVVLVVFAAVVWKVPPLLEAAPAIVSVACCFGGFVDGMVVGAVGGRRGLALAGALGAVWREGFDRGERWP